MNFNPYIYEAKIIDVYDGDTVTAEIDLGFHVKIKEKLRLSEINAPEIRGEEREEGKKSKISLSELILGREVVIYTERDKKGKYGRYLAEIFVKTENGSWIDVNKTLVEQGYAIFKSY